MANEVKIEFINQLDTKFKAKFFDALRKEFGEDFIKLIRTVSWSN